MKNVLHLVFASAVLICFLLACSNFPSSVEDYRKVSRKTYELLSDENKQSLIEDLHDAAQRGDNEALRKTLNRGVPPNAAPRGWTPAIVEAAIKGHSEIIQSLLEFGANVNQKGDNGFTALMAASINKRPEIIRQLLNAKADVNIQDNSGNTALYKAQFTSCDECVELLTKAGGTSSIGTEEYKEIKNKRKK